MEKKLTITGVNGWALPSEWFRDQINQVFEDTCITVICPSHPGNSQEAKRLLFSHEADLYIGYSLGSLWLLKHRKFLPPKSSKALLAPVLGFSQEEGLGGITPKTKLKYMLRLIKRFPEDYSPILEFFSDCDFQIPPPLLNQIPANKILIEGLDFLISNKVMGEHTGGFAAISGELDHLFDSRILKHHIPHLEIIPDAGHAPMPLLKRLAVCFFGGR